MPIQSYFSCIFFQDWLRIQFQTTLMLPEQLPYWYCRWPGNNRNYKCRWGGNVRDVDMISKAYISLQCRESRLKRNFWYIKIMDHFPKKQCACYFHFYRSSWRRDIYCLCSEKSGIPSTWRIWGVLGSSCHLQQHSCTLSYTRTSCDMAVELLDPVYYCWVRYMDNSIKQNKRGMKFSLCYKYSLKKSLSSYPH